MARHQLNFFQEFQHNLPQKTALQIRYINFDFIENLSFDTFFQRPPSFSSIPPVNDPASTDLPQKLPAENTPPLGTPAPNYSPAQNAPSVPVTGSAQADAVPKSPNGSPPPAYGPSSVASPVPSDGAAPTGLPQGGSTKNRPTGSLPETPSQGAPAPQDPTPSASPSPPPVNGPATTGLPQDDQVPKSPNGPAPNVPQNPAPMISGTPINPYPPSLSSSPTDLPGTAPDDLPQDVPGPNYSAGSTLPSPPLSGPTPAVSGSMELQTPDDAPHSGPAAEHPAGPDTHQDVSRKIQSRNVNVLIYFPAASRPTLAICTRWLSTNGFTICRFPAQRFYLFNPSRQWSTAH